MTFLTDHNLEGQVLLLSGVIARLGWLDLLPIRFLTFDEVALPINLAGVGWLHAIAAVKCASILTSWLRLFADAYFRVS